jgi:carotene biosynthesis associated membrane protein
MTAEVPVATVSSVGVDVPAANPVPDRRWAWVPAVLTALAVLAQIGYPLVHGQPRTPLTVATVLIFFSAVVTASCQSRGIRWTGRVVLLTLVVSLLVEAIGTATGFPFGAYRYSRTLGVALLSVPLLVPFAWVMMTIPSLAIARRINGRRSSRIAVATLALASWDVFLDPQLVSAGYWSWQHPHPGIGGVPVTNFVGWLLAAGLLMVLVDQVAGFGPAQRPISIRWSGDTLLIGLYFWTYASSLLANIAFFHRPLVGLAGAIVMGVPVLLAVVALRRETPGPATR